MESTLLLQLSFIHPEMVFLGAACVYIRDLWEIQLICHETDTLRSVSDQASFRPHALFQSKARFHPPKATPLRDSGGGLCMQSRPWALMCGPTLWTVSVSWLV